MKAHIPYREIPKTERKALAVEAYRLSPYLRTVRFIAFLIPMVLAAVLSRGVSPGNDLSGSLVVTVLPALVLSAIIWEIFGRPRLRTEIERIKNA